VRARLDSVLVERRLFTTRARARAAVLAGEVLVEGAVVDKPGAQIAPEATIEVAARRRYVSRGGV
jgi:23S rRNA (cytidine1920-2'-O)/16S rRNA (cytidine1409-2'-O)-methyltransferase